MHCLIEAFLNNSNLLLRLAQFSLHQLHLMLVTLQILFALCFRCCSEMFQRFPGMGMLLL